MHRPSVFTFAPWHPCVFALNLLPNRHFRSAASSSPPLVDSGYLTVLKYMPTDFVLVHWTLLLFATQGPKDASAQGTSGSTASNGQSVPKGYRKGTPIPVVVWLHGLGSRPNDLMPKKGSSYRQLYVAGRI